MEGNSNFKIAISKLEGLNISKSPGPDGIGPRILKEVKDVLALPLQILFSNSIRTGIVPEEWKKSKHYCNLQKGGQKRARELQTS